MVTVTFGITASVASVTSPVIDATAWACAWEQTNSAITSTASTPKDLRIVLPPESFIVPYPKGINELKAHSNARNFARLRDRSGATLQQAKNGIIKSINPD